MTKEPSGEFWGNPAGPKVFPPGTKIADRFTVLECVEIGEKACLYRCHCDMHESEIAVKVLHPTALQDEIAVGRFEKEVLASYTINHPNVIRTFDLIKQDGIVAYGMEYATEGTLQQQLEEGMRYSIDQVIDLCTQVASGLGAIHRAGIIHRDLRPAAIWLTEHGKIKIADFGVAHVPVGKQLTGHGEVIGSADYVSPEYMTTGKVDERSDLYALGLVVFQAATGEFPYPKAATAAASVVVRITVDATPLKNLRSDCPDGLSDIVARLLTKEPKDRFQSADEVIDAIKIFTGDSSGHQVVDSVGSGQYSNAGFDTDEPIVVDFGNQSKPGSTFDEIFGDHSSPTMEIPRERVFSGQLILGLLAVILMAAVGGPLLFNSISNERTSVKNVRPVTQVNTVAPKKPAVKPPVVLSKPETKPEPKAVEIVQPAENLEPEFGPQAEAEQTLASSSESVDPKKPAQDVKRVPNNLFNVPIEPIPLSGESEKEKVAVAKNLQPETPEVEVSTAAESSRYHEVQKGDTVSEISARYKVAEEVIVKANNIVDPDLLSTGAILKIPSEVN